MKIVLLQDLASRTLLAGEVIDKELSEEVKAQLVKEGQAAIFPEEKAVKRDKNKRKKP